MSPNSEPDSTANPEQLPTTDDTFAPRSAPEDTPVFIPASTPEPTPEPIDKRRYAGGMLIYLVLALLAGLTLDGNIRLATWIFLGGLAVKTWLAVLRKPGN